MQSRRLRPSQLGRRVAASAAALAVAAAGAAFAAAPAHAGPGGTVTATVDDVHGLPYDGACLQIILPGKKNSPDVVVTTTAGSGTDGTPGHITQANVPAGSYIGRYFNCGGSQPFVPFYTGLTLDKSKAQTFGVTDGGFTDLGVQLLLPAGDGSIDGIVLDGSTGTPAPSVSVVAYSSKAKIQLTAGCTNQDGHYVLFDLPDNVGGVKLFFGKGANCSNDGNYVTQYLGGSSYAAATPVGVTPGGNTTAATATLALVHKANVSVSGVTFTGDSNNPTITITGNGFGKLAPKPSPTTRPCSEPDVATSGYDYGNKAIMWDTSDLALWQAGFPGDCIGLIFTAYSNTQISFTLNDWYRDPLNNGHLLSNGDPFTVRIKGAPFTGTVSGLS